MFVPHRLTGWLCAVLLCCLSAGAASAQWLVYEVKFTPEDDVVNFSFYTGAYIVAPAQGGAASIILTTEEGGRYFAVSEGAAKFFVAANQRKKKAVFSSAAMRGSALAFYTASGHLNRSLLLDSPTGTRSWRVAEFLTGRLMAADDEAGMAPAPDGSFGMVGGAIIEAALREDLTANATLAYTTLTGATTYVIELLERYGYSADSNESAAPPPEPAAEESGSQIDPSLFPQAVRGSGPES
jgi:hypothetical protein